MYKQIITLFVLLFLVSFLQAQPIQYGISGGFNSSRLVTRNSIDTTRFKSFLSPNVGFQLNWRFHNSWSLHSGVHYAYNGGVTNNISDTLILKERLAYHYVQVPLTVQYIFKDFIFFRGGIYTGFLTNAYLNRWTSEVDPLGQLGNPNKQRINFDDLRYDFHPIDLGTWISGGMQFASGFNLEFRLLRSWVPVKRQDQLYNSVFSLSVNYIINYAEKGTLLFENPSRHIFYGEIGGAAFGASANYEYVFFQDPNVRLLGRAGLGVAPFSTGTALALPVGITALLGRKNHHLELGFVHGNFFENTGVSLIGFGQAGYRYQRRDGGIFFRISYMPYIANYNTRLFNHWAGIGIGYSLKSKKATD